MIIDLSFNHLSFIVHRSSFISPSCTIASNIGNKIQHCAETEGNNRGKRGMVHLHFEGMALKEIDNLRQNGSVPHSDGTRLEEIPAEAADAKCKGGVV